MTTKEWKTVGLLTLAAVLVQALAAGGIARLRGSVDAYAYQSPDASEYVSLARGIAWYGEYVQVLPSGMRVGGPDTWRTPGYPLVLALVIRLFGDSTGAYLGLNALLAVASVPLLWRVLAVYASPRWALIGALGWCLDPFRVYYSFWVMAETLFTTVLIGGCLVWATGRPWSGRRSLLLGAIAGALVLIRPIGLLLPVLAVIGVLLSRRDRKPATVGEGHSRSRRPSGVPLGAACVLGAVLVLGPWVARNRIVGGHWAISSQSGASFAYHKVVDVVLWSQGRADRRFDSVVVAGVRNEIDERLRRRWEEAHGPLSTDEWNALRWPKLNFGMVEGIDPFEASSLLWGAGMEMVSGRTGALVRCFVAQGLSMLTFPLGLVIAPPAGAGSAPLSILGGASGGARVVSVVIGLAYGVLAALAMWRVCWSLVRRAMPAGMFAACVGLTLFVLSLPSEDPRFRLPIVAMMWIVGGGGTERK